MRRIKIPDLKPVKSLKNTLYHHSGEILLETGESLSAEDISALTRIGIKGVIEIQPSDDRRKFLLSCQYRSIDLLALPEGQRLTKPLTDHNGKPILNKETLITREVKANLHKRGMQTVYVKKLPREREINKVREFQVFHSKLVEARITQRVNKEISTLSIDDSNIIRNPAKEISIRGVEQMLKRGLAQVQPGGESLRSKLVQRAKKIKRPDSIKQSFIEVHHSITADVRRLFKYFAEHDTIDGSFAADMSKGIIAGLMRDKDMLLNTLHLPTEESYLTSHSFRVAVIAVNIATALHYSSQQVLEVAYAALLHDVGMFRIPEKIRGKPGKLTQQEYLEIMKHPGYNLDYLQRVKHIPASAPVVTYQVHERLDRSGYPKRKSEHAIHMFAKIISVADIYSALTSDRPYRKALSPFRAARMLVDLGAEGKLDSNVVRNFLQFVCLFPIGSWVRMNNGHIAKVISANTEDYTRPVINVMYNREFSPIRNYILDLREEPKLGIVDGLPSDNFVEDGVMEGF